MSTFLGVVIAAVSILTFVGVVWLFIWAAKKDGEEDRAIQKRLGIRRRTRL
jgi:UDP-N-acetylmuramyl pentapeptide phosphotransferase/UDP-N-acetylglucosamine-1-phosphate transferase